MGSSGTLARLIWLCLFLYVLPCPTLCWSLPWRSVQSGRESHVCDISWTMSQPHLLTGGRKPAY